MTDGNSYYAVDEDGVEIPVRLKKGKAGDSNRYYISIDIPLEEGGPKKFKIFRKKNG
jgi:hypothetical protein